MTQPDRHTSAVDAFIQVRRGSSRLPDKAFADLGEATALAHVVNRLKRCEMLRRVVVCTSDLPEDAELVKTAAELDVDAFQGELDNCLARFMDCARHFETEIIVRVCGDTPLISPELLDMGIRQFLGENADYMGSRSLPVGTYFEIFTIPALERAKRAAIDPNDSADLTYFIGREEINRVSEFDAPADFRRPDLMLALNRQQDLEVLKEVFTRAPRESSVLTLREAIEFLDSEPELKSRNADYTPVTRPEDFRLDPSRLNG